MRENTTRLFRIRIHKQKCTKSAKYRKISFAKFPLHFTYLLIKATIDTKFIFTGIQGLVLILNIGCYTSGFCSEIKIFDKKKFDQKDKNTDLLCRKSELFVQYIDKCLQVSAFVLKL